MARDNNQQLPDMVLQIKQETEELIRMADKAFLQLCGIAWEEDIDHPFATRSHVQAS